MSFSDVSLQLTKKLSKTVKKNYGIFFTPPKIIDALMTYCIKHLQSSKEIRILEPSCGSCEFVRYLDNKFVDAHIDAIEWNLDIYSSIKTLEFKNNTVNIIHADFMDSTTTEYDLIVGNPPYVVCTKEEVPDAYQEYIVGRPNKFGLFILHSLSKLVPDGILAFVIPTSFLNSSYYSKIRIHIVDTCEVLEIADYSKDADFLETDQGTIGLIIRKRVPTSPSPYYLKINGDYVFTYSVEELTNLLEGSTTLEKLGFQVKTGTIVWNQKKELLTSDESRTVLLYNTNVTDSNEIVLTSFKNREKKQYISLQGNTGQVIVVNRGSGNSVYNFKYALVDIGREYLVENHLNVISATKKTKTSMDKIVESFRDPRTSKFIELFFGNGGVSKTELESVLPIYVNDE